MSVMACDRRGCPHVMCDQMILEGTMYICHECMSELREFKETWPSMMTAREVREAIENFMRTSPGTHTTNVLTQEGIDAEFNRLTRDRGDD